MDNFRLDAQIAKLKREAQSTMGYYIATFLLVVVGTLWLVGAIEGKL